MIDKVAIFIPSLQGGGAEHVMCTLATGLSEKGMTIDLVLAKAEGPYLDRIDSDINIIDLNATRVMSSLPALVRYISNAQPTALLSAMNHANIVALWASRLSRIKSRIIVSEHIPPSIQYKENKKVVGQIIYKLMRWFYPWADEIVAVSHGVKSDLCDFIGIAPNNVCVIYNPVVANSLYEKARENTDHPWFENNSIPVVIGIGRLDEQKDFPTLIEAFSQVKKSVDCRLMILGEGSERKRLENQVTELGLKDCVAFPGFVQNPYSYLKRASVFVLSSRFEGLGNVLIEALALGVPVVSTDCPHGPAEILENGRFGKLVKVGDAGQIAEGIVQQLTKSVSYDPPELSPFEYKSVVDQYYGLIKK